MSIIGDKSENLWFNYKFKFSNEKFKEFQINLNPETLNLIPEIRTKFPRWTRLERSQCPNCPLSIDEYSYCPVALNLVDLMEVFKNSPSYEEVEIYIKTNERHYWKRTSLQQGLSSLLGIYMVTSGCPVLEKLKPMVRFHLPFATPQETTYRAVSMYLLAQYLKSSRGSKPDWKLDGLIKIYDEIQIVNISISERLKDIPIQDASLNAVAILDCFANFIRLSIDYEALSDMITYFEPLLDDAVEKEKC